MKINPKTRGKLKTFCFKISSINENKNKKHIGDKKNKNKKSSKNLK